MPRLLLALLLASSLTACDDPSPTPSPEIEPETPEADTPEAPPAPPPLVDPAPAPVTFTVPAEADALPEVESVELGRRVLSRAGGWQVPNVTDELTRTRLTFVFEQLGAALAVTETRNAQGDPFTDEGAHHYGGCRPVLATDRVVSALCYRTELERGGGAFNAFGGKAHLALTDGQVIPFELEDALNEGADLGALITEDLCVEDQLRQGTRRMIAIRQCRPSVNTPEQWVLGATGFEHPYELYREIPPTISVSYAALREHLREDGPLAWVFEAPRPPLWASEEAATGLALTPVLPWAELGTLAATLSDEELERVRAQPIGEDLVGRLVLDSTDALAEARALATRLGGEVHRAQWPDGSLRRIRRVKTTAISDLHTSRTAARPFGAARRTLPEGTHLLAVTGADGSLSGPTMVAGRTQIYGFMPSEQLAPHSGCRPDAGPYLESWPEEQREAALERLHVVSTSIRTDAAGPQQPIALFAGFVGRETRVRATALGESCALGDTVFEETIPGRLFDLRIGTAERAGAGESFLVVGMYHGERRRTWHAYRFSNQRRIFSQTLGPDDLGGNDASLSHYLHLDELANREDESSWAPLIFAWTPYRWTGRLVPVSSD